jgi:hypothetical protein
VLNWSGEPVEQLGLTIRVPFAVRSVRSVLAGELRFEPADGGGVRVTLPVRSADVVTVRP